MNWWNRFNNSLALRVTLLVGSVECVYLFTIFALLPLMFPQTTVFVQFVSSAFLQLILLPLILVGQDLLGKKAEERAQSDHEMIVAEFAEIKALHQDVHQIVSSLAKKNFLDTVACEEGQPQATDPEYICKICLQETK